MDKKEMKTELAKILHRIGALKFGTFKLTSGDLSPYYMDLRVLPSFPQEFRRICDFYIHLIKNNVKTERFDKIAGIPTAGISFASIAAYHLKIPSIYIRSTKRQHGRGRCVEGILLPGDRVLLIDDLITKGGSILKAAKVVSNEGGQVNDALVLVDREENGKQTLANHNINLHSFLTTSEIANEMYFLNAITEEQLNSILKRVKK